MTQKDPARQTHAQAEATALAAAQQMWQQVNAWYAAHPEASFAEIEQQVHALRRPLLGTMITALLRQTDLGASATPPTCTRCQQPLEFKGYRPKQVQGLDGESTIPRAYYVCPGCGAGVFPPRRPFGLAPG